MAMELIYGWMVISMMAIGKIIRHTDMANFILIMVPFILATGLKIRLKVMVFIKIVKDIHIKDHGSEIGKMAMEKKLFKMDLNMLGSSKMDWNMGKAAKNGLIIHNMMGNGVRIKLLDMEFSNGKMEGHMKENG